MKYDLIIIGGGPGGVTAGIYASRQKLRSILITKDFGGGQIGRKAVSIENYPGFKEISAAELVKKFEEHLKNQDIKVEKDEVLKIEKLKNSFFVSTKNGSRFESKAVIVSSGALPRSLGVRGEKEFLGKGVSYCAVCDGPLFSGKKVAVIGGGNSGFETARFLNNIAEKIYILEYSPKVKADKENQDIVGKSGKTTIITSVSLEEIKGEKFVSSIIYKNLESGKEKELFVEGVFIEVGYKPNASFVKELVEFNEKAEIKVSPDTYQTKTPGLFAVGDVNDGLFKQIVIACGEGATAALASFNYIEKIKS